MSLTTFKENILKQYSAVSTSNWTHRQEDRVLINHHKGNEMPSWILKKVLNIWIYSDKRKEMYSKINNFEGYLKKFCLDNNFPKLDTNKESLGLDTWPENEVIKLRSSKNLMHATAELRSHLQLEILALGIGHRAQIVTNIQIKDIILPRLIDEESNDLVLSKTKTKSTYGLCYCPLDNNTLDGCLVYLRFIRTIYQGHYKTIDDWSKKSLFVTHSKFSKEQTKPCQNTDLLLKSAVAEIIKNF